MLDQIGAFLICGFFVALIFVFIVVVTARRLRFANEIMQAYKEGKYENLKNPEASRKIRIIALTSLISLLILFVTIGGLLFMPAFRSSNVIIALIGFAVIIGLYAGFSMLRNLKR